MQGTGIGLKKWGNGELCVCRDGREEIVRELTTSNYTPLQYSRLENPMDGGAW